MFVAYSNHFNFIELWLFKRNRLSFTGFYIYSTKLRVKDLMNWISLQQPEQLLQLKQLSFERPQLIFKHSTRCSISIIAKSRLERSDPPPGVDFYYLDLLNHRALSNQVAEDYDVFHQSPQVLLVINGECIYEETHNAISMEEIADQLVQKK